jgi:hypothetical protein
VSNYTGILSLKGIAKEKFKRDVKSAGLNFSIWANASIYQRFYYNPQVQVKPEIGNGKRI